jgi:hypothetical protein
MDVKFAFETVVVGLLALPWLLVLFHLLLSFFGINLLNRTYNYLKSGLEASTLLGTVLLALAYFIGSSLFPLADSFFNEHGLFCLPKDKYCARMPFTRNDDEIRVQTYLHYYYKKKFYRLCPENFPSYLSAEVDGLNCNVGRIIEEHGGKTEDLDEYVSQYDEKNKKDKLEDKIHALYNHQKFQDYRTEKGYEILSPLKNQITMLRGAVLNACILLIVLLIFIVALLLDRWYMTRQLKGRNLPEDSIKSARLSYKRWLWVALLALFPVTAFCILGAYGVSQSEEEYDKQVIGIFHSSQEQARQDSSERKAYCGPCFEQKEPALPSVTPRLKD